MDHSRNDNIMYSNEDDLPIEQIYCRPVSSNELENCSREIQALTTEEILAGMESFYEYGIQTGLTSDKCFYGMIRKAFPEKFNRDPGIFWFWSTHWSLPELIFLLCCDELEYRGIKA